MSKLKRLLEIIYESTDYCPWCGCEYGHAGDCEIQEEWNSISWQNQSPDEYDNEDE